MYYVSSGGCRDLRFDPGHMNPENEPYPGLSESCTVSECARHIDRPGTSTAFQDDVLVPVDRYFRIHFRLPYDDSEVLRYDYRYVKRNPSISNDSHRFISHKKSTSVYRTEDSHTQTTYSVPFL